MKLRAYDKRSKSHLILDLGKNEIGITSFGGGWNRTKLDLTITADEEYYKEHPKETKPHDPEFRFWTDLTDLEVVK